MQKNESLFVTYSGSKNIYTWTVLSDGRVHLHSATISRNELNNKVQTLRKALDLQIATLKDVPVYDVELAHEFYNNLLRPSAHLSSQKTTVC